MIAGIYTIDIFYQTVFDLIISLSQPWRLPRPLSLAGPCSKSHAEERSDEESVPEKADTDFSPDLHRGSK